MFCDFCYKTLRVHIIFFLSRLRVDSGLSKKRLTPKVAVRPVRQRTFLREHCTILKSKLVVYVLLFVECDAKIRGIQMYSTTLILL